MIRYIIITLIYIAYSVIPAFANNSEEPISDTSFVKKDNFWPTLNRVNRNINKITFAYKGEFMGGVTASYGTIASEDSELLAIINGIDAQLTTTSVKPFIGYFYSNNKCIGLRFGYSGINGGIDSAQIYLGPSNDISLDIPYMHLTSNSYSCSIFHRNYAGLDARGRIGLFAEIELEASSGNYTYEFSMGDTDIISRNKAIHAGLNFNPGIAVYVLPNVCTSLSFGLGGIDYNLTKQLDDSSNVIGQRDDSKLSLRLDLTAINIGITLHLWDKSK